MKKVKITVLRKEFYAEESLTDGIRPVVLKLEAI